MWIRSLLAKCKHRSSTWPPLIIIQHAAVLNSTPWFRTLDSSDSLADASCVGEALQVGVFFYLFIFFILKVWYPQSPTKLFNY
jgi:hypothetical protein